MKLLVCDKTDAAAIEAMRAAGIEVDVKTGITPEELIATVPAYHAMVVRSATKVRVPVIDAAKNLKVIIRGGVGLDNIDAEYAQGKGITVVNTPKANSNAVAELIIGLMVCMARQISRADATMKAGQWEKKTFGSGIELEGKMLGIVGCGRIGQMVAEKAYGLGMGLLGCDPWVSSGHEHMSMTALEGLLPHADFITLHMALTDETRGMIGAAQFAIMKTGVYIINAARGGVLDEAALYDAIVSGKVAGAALDVFSEEPPQSEALKKLIALPQVIATPHMGAGTNEALERVGGEVAQLAIEFARRYSEGG